MCAAQHLQTLKSSAELGCCKISRFFCIGSQLGREGKGVFGGVRGGLRARLDANPVCGVL